MNISSQIIKNRLPQSRLDFPLYLNQNKLNGFGVEIGVQTGEYSEFILANSRLNRLYSIDSWYHFENVNDVSNVSQYEQDDLYMQTILRLKKFGLRSVVMRMQSELALNHFLEDFFDFIYIDANHTYEGVKFDLTHWWLKLKKGGIFAGHDYLNGIINDTEFGVKQAVDEFVKTNNLTCHIVDHTYPTWYIIK